MKNALDLKYIMKSSNFKNGQYKVKNHQRISNDKNKSYNFRIYILFFLVFISALAIIFRLYNLGVSAHGYYQKLADNQHSIFKKLVPKRGEIYLKDNGKLYPVAVNKQTKMVYAVPEEIDDPAKTAKILAKILSLDEEKLRASFSQSNSAYKVVKHRLDENEIEAIKNVKLRGIHLVNETYRYYPAQKLASQVVGFVGWRKNNFGGRYGIENYFDTQLKGQKGDLYQNHDNSGNWVSISKKEITPAKNGESIVLTIDHTIQYETEKMLQSAVEKFKAKGGTIVVMNPNNGKILAMASYPNFDPNDYGKVEDMKVFRNLAVSSPYECGSVFKTITLAAALDNDKVTPETTYTDTGVVRSAGYAIRNADLKAHGVQTMTQVLERSLNTGAVYMEQLLGNKNFADYARRFGFGQKTGIELPGENAGNISNLNNLKRNIQFYTASFGQGITVTPLQLAVAYSAIANGGKMMKPQIIDKIVSANGDEKKTLPQEVRRVISQKAALQTAQVLRKVVSEGEGKRAGVPGYLVGGKTGTAQVASSTQRGYTQGESIGSFAGFAPVNDPQFTIVVRIDDPKTVEWAESSAAPTFGELMKFLLNYEDIKPTEKFTQSKMDAFNRTHTLSDYFIKNDEKNASDNKQDNEKQ